MREKEGPFQSDSRLLNTPGTPVSITARKSLARADGFRMKQALFLFLFQILIRP